MRSLGLDIGGKRTGVAISDPQGILAIPLTVIANGSEDATIDDVIKLAQQHQVGRIVIGLPRSLDGSLNQQANKVTAFANKLSHRLTYNPSPFKGEGKSEGGRKIDIRLWDERLSTVAAEKLMVEAGTKKNKRKQHRDAIAAAFILQGFLDSLKAC